MGRACSRRLQGGGDGVGWGASGVCGGRPMLCAAIIEYGPRSRVSPDFSSVEAGARKPHVEVPRRLERLDLKPNPARRMTQVRRPHRHADSAAARIDHNEIEGGWGVEFNDGAESGKGG